MEEFLRNLRHCPKYSRDELIELGRRYRRTHNQHIRDQMVLAVLPYAVQIAKRYQKSGMALDDLASLAMEGVMRAVEKFDPDRDIAFTTYATFWVKQYILRELRSGRFLIHLPEHCWSKTLKRDNKMQAAIDAVQSGISSLNDFDECGHPVGDSLIASQDMVGDVENAEERQRMHRLLNKAIASLSAAEKYVVQRRLAGCTLDVISVSMKVSKERVRQIESAAKANLKNIMLQQDSQCIESWMAETRPAASNRQKTSGSTNKKRTAKTRKKQKGKRRHEQRHD
jgi:RNA polymerase sigma factor (sigma-70 family)